MGLKIWVGGRDVPHHWAMQMRGCSEQSIGLTNRSYRRVNLSTYMLEQDTERIQCKNVLIDIGIYIDIGVSGLTV